MVNTEFYKNGKIYKIIDNTTGNIYIGCTCKKLCQRIAQHRTAYKSFLNGTGNYITSFEILKNGNYSIILLEVYSCESKEQLNKRERYYIDTIECVNKVIPTRTNKEYYEANKETFKNNNKIYYEDNKEINKIYRETNKDKIKKYYEDNKDKILKQKKIYCEANKQNIAAKRHERYINKKLFMVLDENKEITQETSNNILLDEL
jgi:hypothetical protein